MRARAYDDQDDYVPTDPAEHVEDSPRFIGIVGPQMNSRPVRTVPPPDYYREAEPRYECPRCGWFYAGVATSTEVVYRDCTPCQIERHDVEQCSAEHCGFCFLKRAVLVKEQS